MVDVESDGPIPGDFSMVSTGCLFAGTSITLQGQIHSDSVLSILAVFTKESKKTCLKHSSICEKHATRIIPLMML